MPKNLPLGLYLYIANYVPKQPKLQVPYSQILRVFASDRSNANLAGTGPHGPLLIANPGRKKITPPTGNAEITIAVKISC